MTAFTVTGKLVFEFEPETARSESVGNTAPGGAAPGGFTGTAALAATEDHARIRSEFQCIPGAAWRRGDDRDRDRPPRRRPRRAGRQGPRSSWPPGRRAGTAEHKAFM